MDKQILDNIKQALMLHLPQSAEAILYGSQARGEEHADSDWDILVILDKEQLLPEDYDNITYPIAKLGWDLGTEINPIMYTKREWEASRITPFYHNVQQDGIYLT